MKILFVTATPQEADRLVETLLQERLIAGANMVSGVQSRYWWKGVMESAAETALFMETDDDRVAPAIQRITEIHSYEVPKIVVINVEEANQPYLQWVFETTRPPIPNS